MIVLKSVKPIVVENPTQERIIFIPYMEHYSCILEPGASETFKVADPKEAKKYYSTKYKKLKINIL